MLDQSLDAHAKPPQTLRAIYKKYQKAAVKIIDNDISVFDPLQGQTAGFEASATARQILDLPDDINEIMARFLANAPTAVLETGTDTNASPLAYEHPLVPGTPSCQSISKFSF